MGKKKDEVCFNQKIIKLNRGLVFHQREFFIMIKFPFLNQKKNNISDQDLQSDPFEVVKWPFWVLSDLELMVDRWSLWRTRDSFPILRKPRSVHWWNPLPRISYPPLDPRNSVGIASRSSFSGSAMPKWWTMETCGWRLLKQNTLKLVIYMGSKLDPPKIGRFIHVFSWKGLNIDSCQYRGSSVC